MQYIIVLIFLINFTASAKPTYQNIIVSELVSVYDGDTITVNIDNFPPVIGESISIRIRGIDAPEIRSKCPLEKIKAIQARDYLRATLASGEAIELHDVERGKYFRLVANVIVDGVDVSKLMIEKQLAREYDGKSKRVVWCG
jgi:micrococcal nuclease